MHMFVDKTEYWSKEGILFYFNGREDRTYIFNREMLVIEQRFHCDLIIVLLQWKGGQNIYIFNGGISNRVEAPFCPLYCSTSMEGTEHIYSTEVLVIEQRLHFVVNIKVN